MAAAAETVQRRCEMISFIIGFVIGAWFGILVIAMLIAGRK